jgi:ABC-2 type transport system permease protein
VTLRLFLHVVGLEARTSMSYRVDFWIRTVAVFLVQLGVYLFLTWAIFAEAGTTEVRGFTEPQMIQYFVTVMLLGKLTTGAAFENAVANEIYQGGLTRYLLFPRPYLPFQYARSLGGQVSTLLQLLLFGAAAWWFAGGEGLALDGATLARTATSLVAANLLYYLLRLPLEMVAFWHDNVWSLVVMLRNISNLLGGGLIPLALFPDAFQPMLAWLPFRHLFAVPVGTLLGRIDAASWAAELAAAVAWILVLAAISAAVWRRGTRQYTGVGI